MTSLGLVAGEASGDLLGADLLRALSPAALTAAGLNAPPLRTVGIGGERMATEGFEAWWPSERLSVMGYTDALKRLAELLWMRRRLGTRLLAERAACFVGIDAPDFNFGLEKRLRAAGMPVVHYVCPSIWAWRPERVDTIRAAADHVLCLFPFEPALLQAAGIRATFVGHPLAQHIPLAPDRAAARRALGLSDADSVLALLPGSRRSEIDLILPPMLDAVRRLRADLPALRVVLPIAPGLRERVTPLCRETGVDLLAGRSHEALAACDLTLVASGTATLEAALFKRPMVIAYKVSPANYRRMRRLQLQPWVGLPNVLAQDFLVPECLQDGCTGEALARAARAWLDAPAAVSTLQARFEDLHQSIRADTAARCREVLAPFLRQPGWV